MTLTAVKGSWLEKVGDRYEANTVKFEPSRVAAGSSATIKVTIPSACTSGSYGSSLSSTGEYRVTVRVITSTRVHAISAGNQHQILAALPTSTPLTPHPPPLSGEGACGAPDGAVVAFKRCLGWRIRRSRDAYVDCCPRLLARRPRWPRRVFPACLPDRRELYVRE